MPAWTQTQLHCTGCSATMLGPSSWAGEKCEQCPNGVLYVESRLPLTGADQYLEGAA